MPIPFEKYEYLFWGDMERNPHRPFSHESFLWDQKANADFNLVALDRYAARIIREAKEKQNSLPFVVGKVGDNSVPRKYFSSEAQAATYLSLLEDQDAVLRGDYYLDDMEADEH